MYRKDLQTWNLKEIIREIVTNFSTIEAIYIFGSRAYRTNSYRSDIDLLVHSPQPLVVANLLPWLQEKYSPVDLFVTGDMRSAQSLVNGSAIYSNALPVNEKLEAIELWSKSAGFITTYDNWQQSTLVDADFAATILPISRDFSEIISTYHRKLSELGIPDTHLGFDWPDIARRLASIVEQAIQCIPSLGKKAKQVSASNIIIKNEYDFQNIIHIALKPWLPSLAVEPFIIKYDGQQKNADFSIDSSIIIEAKHIKDASTEAAVIKSISGLDEFYRTNPNVKCVLFLVLIEHELNVDCAKIEEDYSELSRVPSTVVKLIRNNPLS